MTRKTVHWRGVFTAVTIAVLLTAAALADKPGKRWSWGKKHRHMVMMKREKADALMADLEKALQAIDTANKAVETGDDETAMKELAAARKLVEESHKKLADRCVMADASQEARRPLRHGRRTRLQHALPDHGYQDRSDQGTRESHA
ncbi:MAG: hypothetical protein ACYSTL_06685 [Planctomycetota bacterium]